MVKDDSVHPRHSLDATQLIEKHLLDVHEKEFKATRLLQAGIVQQIEIMGKAVCYISKDLCQSYPEVPWQDIAGMRDQLIHDYFEVDLEKVWEPTK